MIVDLGVVIGFEPESDNEPAHFFIADERTQVCCTPVSGFDELDRDELPKMAAFMWTKLKGEQAHEQLAYTIASAWIRCFEMFEAGEVCSPPTFH